MILSKYNIYAEKDNVVTIFNTLISALVQLNKNSFDNLLTDNNNPSTIRNPEIQVHSVHQNVP